jgi:hypothetical protein
MTVETLGFEITAKDEASDVARTAARNIERAALGVEQANLKVEKATAQAAAANRKYAAGSVEVRDAQLKLRQAQSQAGDSAAKLATAQSRARAELQRTSDAAKDAGKSVGKMSAEMKTAAAAGGVLAGAAIAKGIADGMDFSAARAKLQAQLGLTAEDAKKYGKAAGDVYADNYGNSIEDVNEAIRQSANQGLIPPDATNEQIESITKRVLALADAFEQDLGGTARAAAQLIRTGLAKDADEAFDLIAAGLQRIPGAGDDLLDTINEYSTQFRSLGITGTQALAFIQSAMLNGARDADVAADALKEFNLRTRDITNTGAQQALSQLGLNAQEMAQRVAGGGSSAAAAMAEILTQLEAYPDPANRAAIATALFGTQSEDLQDALLQVDPSVLIKGMGDVAGAAGDVDTALGSTAQSKIESYKRHIQELAYNAVDTAGPLGALAAGVVAFGGTLLAGGSAVAQITDTIRDWRTSNKEAAAAAEQLAATEAVEAAARTRTTVATEADTVATNANTAAKARNAVAAKEAAYTPAKLPALNQVPLSPLGPGAAGSTKAMSAELGVLSRSASAAKAGLAGITGILGGPWGIAIGVGITALTTYAQRQADAKQFAQELTGALDQQTGAVTDAARAVQFQKLQQDGAIDAAKELGISLKDVTDAASGNEEAVKRVAGALNAHSKGLLGDSANQATLIAALGLQNSALDDSREALGDQKEAGVGAAGAQKDLAATTGETTAALKDERTAAEKLKGALDDLNGKHIASDEAAIDFRDSLRDLKDAIKENGKSFSESTKEGDANRQSFINASKAAAAHVVALRDEGKSSKEVREAEISSRKALIDSAVQMGVNRIEAEKLANEYFRIPKNRKTELQGDIRDLDAKIKTAKEKLRDPKLTDPEKAKIRADISDLLAKKKRAQEELDGLRNKTVQVLVQYQATGKQNALGQSTVAGGGRYSTGGRVTGRGTGDSVPALLTPEEHVLTVAEVKALGGHAAVEKLRSAALKGQPVAKKEAQLRFDNEQGGAHSRGNSKTTSLLYGYTMKELLSGKLEDDRYEPNDPRAKAFRDPAYRAREAARRRDSARRKLQAMMPKTNLLEGYTAKELRSGVLEDDRYEPGDPRAQYFKDSANRQKELARRGAGDLTAPGRQVGPARLVGPSRSAPVTIDFGGKGGVDELGGAFLRYLRKQIRVQGGDVQRVLGAKR